MLIWCSIISHYYQQLCFIFFGNLWYTHPPPKSSKQQNLNDIEIFCDLISKSMNSFQKKKIILNEALKWWSYIDKNVFFLCLTQSSWDQSSSFSSFSLRKECDSSVMKLMESITSERCCILHFQLHLWSIVLLDLNIKYTYINIHYTTDSLLQSVLLQGKDGSICLKQK